jgi:subtilisin family serine protease
MPLLGALALAATVIVQSRNGKPIQISTPAVAPSRSFIVEFRDGPLIVNETATSRNTTERFHRDLANLRIGKLGSESAPAIKHEYFRTFHGVSVTLDEAARAAVQSFAYVKKVYEDTPVKAFASEDTGRLERLHVDRVWSGLHAHGNGIVVAVIDSGVDYHHAALGGGIGPGFKVIGGIDYVGGDDDPMDENGHGTHVAGIIAGGNDEVRGVAPDAHLLAFRVLNAQGEGYTSDIIAAIERTVDPNLDGDFSDHADVANMSLGGIGDADSPLSLAVDRATEAGVVFCLAAGNDPGEPTVGSPASARLGITVGNSDSDDALAPSSSRGPAFPDWGLKPEVVAPGTLIRSARMGGGTLVASGTSMAAPHVAGTAALLLELHPDWTPADVKAALVGSAHPIDEAVIGQGGGRIDAFAAATSEGAISPAAVTFGRHGTKGPWTSTRMVRIANRGTHARTYIASFTTPSSVKFTAEPSQFTLDAGASRDVTLTAAMSTLGDESYSFSRGGRVTFTSADAAVQVPWVAIDAARVTIATEVASSVLWDCATGPSMAQSFPNYTHDLLMPNSACDLIMLSIPNGKNILPMVIAQARTIQDDVALDVTAADAPYEMRMTGTNQKGVPISADSSNERAPYLAAYDLQFPPTSNFQELSFSVPTSEPLRMSDLGNAFTLTASELSFDFPNASVYAIHHPPLHGVHGSMTLSSLPSDLRHAHVRFAPQPAGTVLDGTSTYMAGGGVATVGVGAAIGLEAGWEGDVYITPETNEQAWAGAGLQTSRPDQRVWLDLYTPTFRAIGDRIVLSNEIVPSESSHGIAGGGTIEIGATPLRIQTGVLTNGTAFKIFPSVYGPANEFSSDASTGFRYELRDAGGTLLREGTEETYAVTADFGHRGVFHAKLRSKTGVQSELTFDTSQGDFSPPALVAFRLVRSDGGIVRSVAPHTPAALEFSLFEEHPRTARASWRTADGGAWQELPLITVSQDLSTNYRADLAAITASVMGAIDVRIEADDANGNTMTSTFDGALMMSQRRRAAGK